MTMALQRNDHVLFYGDSITDAGRQGKENNPDGMGVGYPAMISARLQARFPELGLRFTNRGISGNRVYDLESRLQTDVLDLKPTVVSILIGINDTWRRYDSNVVSPVTEFAAGYRRILTTLRGALKARIVVCEPFLLPIPDDRKQWREDLDPRIAAVRDLAREFQAIFVPLDGIFAAAACRAPMSYWLPDGVHPTQAGHGLIAEWWIRTVVE
jgi:lysophospholipase L1-like esterase